jgi:hypothetical protein
MYFEDMPARDEVRRASVALRQWSVSLRAWSRTARSRSAAVGSARFLVVPPAVPPTSEPVEDGSVSLGLVAVSELFVILVDNHGLSTRKAVASLVVELKRAGYPSDASSVAASDGFDIVQAILDRGA